MPGRYSHAFVLSHCDNLSLWNNSYRRLPLTAPALDPDYDLDPQGLVPVRFAQPQTVTPPPSRSQSAADSLLSTSSAITQIYAPEPPDSPPQIHYHQTQSSPVTVPPRASPPRYVVETQPSPRSPPARAASGPNILRRYSLSPPRRSLNPLNYAPRPSPTAKRVSFDYQRPFSIISEKPTEEEEQYLYPRTDLNRSASAHTTEDHDDNASLSSLSSLPSLNSSMNYAPNPHEQRQSLQSPQPRPSTLSVTSRYSTTHDPPSDIRSAETGTTTAWPSRPSSRGSSIDDAAPPPVIRLRREEDACGYPPEKQKGHSRSKSVSTSGKTKRLGFLKSSSPSASSTALPTTHKLFHGKSSSNSSSSSDTGLRPFVHHSSTTHAAPLQSPLAPSVPSAAPPARALTYGSVTSAPSSESRTSAAQSFDPSSQSSNPATLRWQASEFDIEGLLTEKELKRLRKKGVNPQLKMEMEAATKGRRFGTLVGNTFIG